jgi:hypothetical protein
MITFYVQTWTSLLLFWHFVFAAAGIVIYEIIENDVFIAVLVDGTVINVDHNSVKEYTGPGCIRIVDCKASKTSSDSDRFDYRGTTRFVISSPNLDAHRQIMRHPTVWT